MNRMADSVQKSNAAERELERRVVQYQVEKEQRDQANEEKKKEDVKRKLTDIKKTLDIQISEKKLQKQHEDYVKEEYMKKWVAMSEEENARRKQEEEQGKKRRLEVKDFLLMQMGGDEAVSSKKPKAMNVEELRINKQLLKEIS